ncbi:hypothetical protein DPEC_G00049310 [Dallia pectoralis]|uniref:Uncharacterized protein n=1 Tax=Dallia pectoralis TaxID=75939 RepID=A0ACC2HB25_DALPE|nr:hypothetical protein DPEC_G00049310 [Dallia pectoralis]
MNNQYRTQQMWGVGELLGWTDSDSEDERPYRHKPGANSPALILSSWLSPDPWIHLSQNGYHCSLSGRRLQSNVLDKKGTGANCQLHNVDSTNVHLAVPAGKW